MAAGLATFLISALFGHPLLIPQVAAAFFLALGLTSALFAAPANSRVGQVVLWTAILGVVVSLPWRILDARTAARDEEGSAAVVGTLDDVPYRIAGAESTWRIASDAQVVTLPLRWEEPGLPSVAWTSSSTAASPIRCDRTRRRGCLCAFACHLPTRRPTCVSSVAGVRFALPADGGTAGGRGLVRAGL